MPAHGQHDVPAVRRACPGCPDKEQANIYRFLSLAVLDILGEDLVKESLAHQQDEQSAVDAIAVLTRFERESHKRVLSSAHCSLNS